MLPVPSSLLFSNPVVVFEEFATKTVMDAIVIATGKGATSVIGR